MSAYKVCFFDSFKDIVGFYFTIGIVLKLFEMLLWTLRALSPILSLEVSSSKGNPKCCKACA